MPQRLRVFISSPADVANERLRADLILDKLAQDYSRFFAIESYRWEHEAMLSSHHFQDAIEPPSRFDIVVLILWSRLGTLLPEKTSVREYRGIDDRVPVTGTEWEYEEALKAARERGAPDLLAFRKISGAAVDPLDPDAQARAFAQLNALNEFWRRHFADRGVFLAAYDQFQTLDEFAHRLEESLRRLIERRIEALVASTEPQREPVWLGEPFRGLQSYEYEHAPIFFGRDASIMKGTEQLVDNTVRLGVAFLLVLGASGSGKSSIVKAGIVPRLCKPQRINGVGFLRRLVFRPAEAGTDIVLGLARALTDVRGEDGLPELITPGQDAEKLAAYMRTAISQTGYLFSNALGRVTQVARDRGRLLPYEEAKLILVVDQLEELFTAPSIVAAERRLFIQILDALARSGAVWVIATLRADFWHRAIEFPELVGLAEGKGRLDLSAPSLAELAEMIRKPAQSAGLSFEVHPDTGLGLDVVLAEHASNSPGVLPLLSFTLDELYKDLKQHGAPVLTYASYEALGQLQGAIAQRAESVLAGLPDAARLALPRVLRALVTAPESADQMPAARGAALERFPEGSPARVLVDAFTAARLLVASEERSASTVRLAHEALITRWGRARDQLASDRRDLETRALVERQFERWTTASAHGRRLLLLRDPDLANAVALAQRWPDELEPALLQFVGRSRRRARLRHTITAAAAIVFAILAVGAGAAAKLARDARLEAEVSLWLAYSRDDLKAGRVDSALEWAWRAFSQNQVGDTRSAVLDALLQISPYLSGRLNLGSAFPQALAWVNDETLAYTTSSGDLDFLDASGRAEGEKRWLARGIAQAEQDREKRAVVGLRLIGPERLAGILRGGTIVSVNARDNNAKTLFPGRVPLNSGPHAAVISADGSLMATAPTADFPRLYRCRAVLDGASPACSEDRALLSNFASAVELSPGGDRVALGTQGGGITMVSVSGLGSSASLTPGFPVVSLAWNPSRDWLAVGGEQGTIAVFDTRSHSEISRFTAGKGIISVLGWNSSGEELAFVCDSRILCIARFNSDGEVEPDPAFQRFQGHNAAITRLAWSPDGARLATADAGHDIIVWSLAPDSQVAFDLRASGGTGATAIAVSLAAKYLAAMREDGDISIWDAQNLLQSDRRLAVDEASKPDGGAREPAALACRYDGALAVAYKDGVIAMWPPNLKDMPRIKRVSLEPSQLAFTGRGSHIAVVTADRALYIGDPDSADFNSAVHLELPKPARPTWAVAAHPNDALLSASYDGGQIAVWDLTTQQVAYLLPIVDPIAPLGLTVSPDGRFLGATGGDRYVKVYDLEKRAIWDRLPTKAEETAGSIGFSPDGRMLATIGADDRIYLWEMGSGSALPFLQVDADASGQYASGLAWLSSSQVVILRANGAIRVINLDVTSWRNRLNSLHFRSMVPGQASASAPVSP
jgi:WD40 repeat protein